MIKDKAIMTRDGAEVKEGKFFFTLRSKNVNDERYRNASKTEIVKFSGRLKYYLEEGTIIHVNQAANARTFTVRSSKGCEATYSVKDACLPEETFGRRVIAIKALKEANNQNLLEVKDKMDKVKEKLKLWEYTYKKMKTGIKGL